MTGQNFQTFFKKDFEIQNSVALIEFSIKMHSDENKQT